MVGTYHTDDEDYLLYKVTRVVVRKGIIVAYRAHISAHHNRIIEDATPIFVKDVVRMTRLRPSEGKCDTQPVEERPGEESQRDASADSPSDRGIGGVGAPTNAIIEGARVHGAVELPTAVPSSTLDP